MYPLRIGGQILSEVLKNGIQAESFVRNMHLFCFNSVFAFGYGRFADAIDIR